MLCEDYHIWGHAGLTLLGLSEILGNDVMMTWFSSIFALFIDVYR